ncbi:MAG: APC family permease, partial [Acidithiobacillus sp.]|nr:APC family permease [Acidithiobacillus sp.]
NNPFWSILHDEVSFVIQDRLQRDGFSMMIVPVHVRGMPSKLAPISLSIDFDPDMELVQTDSSDKKAPKESSNDSH